MNRVLVSAVTLGVCLLPCVAPRPAHAQNQADDGAVAPPAVAAHVGDGHAGGGHGGHSTAPPVRRYPRPTDRVLPSLPGDLPAWLSNRQKNEIFPKRGPYNYALAGLKALDADLNAVAVGHAMAYEDLVTGREATLETATFQRIDGVLKRPPRFMPDEATISPAFARRYGVLEQVFEWAHVFHGQTFDVLASPKLSNAEKDREIERLWQFYSQSVPYSLSPLPMNMDWLDAQPYSGAFRQKYPKVNGLFWGYHWLQGAAYDTLRGLTPQQQSKSYEMIGAQYRVELRKTDRLFMPMLAEVSPNFAARFPHIANAFDNLHMLHDMVNDILASDWMTDAQRDEQIKRAIWLVSAAAHEGERAGDFDAQNGLHDHRFVEGMPGMGLMPGGSTQVMYMAGQGWMSMDECHHCSMGFPDGQNRWKVSTVVSNGWAMRVRCPLCARDMSRELKGAALFRIPLETPDQTLVVFADEMGNLTTDTPQVVFLEEPGDHAKCHLWSQAFSGRAAFDKWIEANPKYAAEKALTFAEWADKEAEDTPATYMKPHAPGAENAPGETTPGAAKVPLQP